MSNRLHPTLIQGGMGVGVSLWPLARAVGLTGQLGVVSGTALGLVLARRLQDGDEGGHLRRALAAFPYPEMARRILERYFVPGGIGPGAHYRSVPVPAVEASSRSLELTVVSNFAEVFLAKEGHDGPIGINYLEKIQLPTLPSIFGAMLAGVDYVLMGAGIPRAIPGILDRLAAGRDVELSLHVQGAERGDDFTTRFDPVAFTSGSPPGLKRPRFLAIVASATLATMLARRATGHVDGFVIEGPTAGGHNAPPRGASRENDRGEPIYGERDLVDLEVFRALGRPFWLAGSFGSPEKVAEALAAGAAGVQVGTAFAFCEESGLSPDIKRRAHEMCRSGTTDVVTDPLASPAGFPFKVLQLPGSVSEQDRYEGRPRICDLGYLRHAFKMPDGRLGWRCPSERVRDYLRKGGSEEETVRRKCVCNGLLANVGLGQTHRCGYQELPLVTAGDDASQISRFLPTPDAEVYSARDVVDHLLAAVTVTPAAR